MFLLSLIAALAGTPLRLAEAAYDIACFAADLGDDSVIELPDGGVGDDSDATIKGETILASITLVPADSLPSLFTLVTPIPTQVLSPRTRADRPPRFTVSPGRRYALLQRYLC